MIPLVTEKAVRIIERENVLMFVVDKRLSKTEIKKQIEETFDVKIDKVRTLLRNNKKYVYAKLNKKNLAIDLATKLGLM